MTLRPVPTAVPLRIVSMLDLYIARSALGQVPCCTAYIFTNRPAARRQLPSPALVATCLPAN
jgi:hypothetical protein